MTLTGLAASMDGLDGLTDCCLLRRFGKKRKLWNLERRFDGLGRLAGSTCD